MKIFEALRKDHDKQRALIKLLLETKGDSEIRAEYFQKLKEELETHAIAEERHFYAPLMKADATIELSRHGIAEHHEIDELIEKLEETEQSSPAWLATFKQLAHKVEHHLSEEEREFFQQAGKTLSEQQKSNLASDYTSEMNS